MQKEKKKKKNWSTKRSAGHFSTHFSSGGVDRASLSNSYTSVNKDRVMDEFAGPFRNLVRATFVGGSEEDTSSRIWTYLCPFRTKTCGGESFPFPLLISLRLNPAWFT